MSNTLFPNAPVDASHPSFSNWPIITPYGNDISFFFHSDNSSYSVPAISSSIPLAAYAKNAKLCKVGFKYLGIRFINSLPKIFVPPRPISGAGFPPPTEATTPRLSNTKFNAFATSFLSSLFIHAWVVPVKDDSTALSIAAIISLLPFFFTLSITSLSDNRLPFSSKFIALNEFEGINILGIKAPPISIPRLVVNLDVCVAPFKKDSPNEPRNEPSSCSSSLYWFANASSSCNFMLCNSSGGKKSGFSFTKRMIAFASILNPAPLPAENLSLFSSIYL